jgi:hypothetical protein
VRPSELIVDEKAFATLSGECNRIINVNKRLPDFVFKCPFPRYFAIEHAHVFTKEFGVFLSKMATFFNDQRVNYMTLDPDPVDYYYRNCSFFGLASFDPSNLEDRYMVVMSREGNVDSFRSRGGDVSAFWGSSLKWGIFCDRISWEIAVIAVSEDVPVPALGNFRCMDGPWLSAYIASQYTRDNSTARDFTKRFLHNYPL